ncbi:HNH endonuclease, partial [Arthrobacter sp. NPDC093128]
MEAVGDLAAGGALRWAVPTAASAVQPTPAARVRGLRSVPAGLQHPDALASDGGGSGDLARCLEL